MMQINICYSISVLYPSIHFLLFSLILTWSPEQEFPDLPFLSHLLQFIQGNTEAFPGQPREE